MVKLVVVADDFTGALDTGIKFAEAGAQTQVMLKPDFGTEEIRPDSEVLIVDAETRHLDGEAAYHIVYDLVRRCKNYGIKYFYKKTDSALRGNVGSELSAVSDAAGCSVSFVPALPKLNRITKDGIQYIDGVPVADSLFGKDPFEPVTKSAVAEVIHEGTGIEVVVVKNCKQIKRAERRAIYVYDAKSNLEMENIARELKDTLGLEATAGCAGFADCLTKVIDFSHKREAEIRRVKNLLIVCGSVNEITKRQIKYAEKAGFRRISLNVVQKLQPGYFETEEARRFLNDFYRKCSQGMPVIMDVFSHDDAVEEAAAYGRLVGVAEENIRECIVNRLGEFIDLWLGFGVDGALSLSGGDTVYAFLQRKGCKDIRPVCEIMPGAVLFETKVGERTMQVVSKSGGFGNESIFVEIADKMMVGGVV